MPESKLAHKEIIEFFHKHLGYDEYEEYRKKYN
jgi:hypothetical protein